MNEFNTSSKFDLEYAEHKVIFSICDCTLNKKYSFYNNLTKEKAKKFLGKLQYFEKYTWRQFANLSRENGVTCERKNSDNFNLIHNENTLGRNVLEQYYYHFRVEPRGLFRIFGYQKEQIFYITHIDPNGKINH